MRELKFKFWLSGPKRMVQWSEFKKDYAMPWLNDYSMPIMQYTGLKDINGTEIYEGDITRFTNNSGNIVRVCAWNERHSGWRFNGYEYSQQFIKATELEVIGNIYENPDLINEN